MHRKYRRLLTSHPTLQTLRRRNEEIARRVAGLIEWESFTLDGFQNAVAARMDGEIFRIPFHWQDASLFGITLGTTDAQGRRRWLVLYEADTDPEHQLVIILHELMHILLGHGAAEVLVPEKLREILSAIGWLSDETMMVAYTRCCARDSEQPVALDVADEEYEAELGATWVIIQVRRTGALPPSGYSFLPEHRTIDVQLGRRGS